MLLFKKSILICSKHYLLVDELVDRIAYYDLVTELPFNKINYQMTKERTNLLFDLLVLILEFKRKKE